jgi:enoyl-[acyl-carrier protein] reductase III
MVNEFKEQQYWAVILGGSSGLGLASALKLASHGMNICLVHRSSRAELEAVESSLKPIRAQVELLTFNLDVIKEESRKLVMEALHDKLNGTGKIRCLLHSIAKGNLKPLINGNNAGLNSADFLLTMHNMAISLADWTRDLHQADLFADDARVLSFTSEGARKAMNNYAAVAAAKAALEAITRNIALEYAPVGIRANCIQAGVTDTGSLRKIPGSEELIEHSINRNPFKRLTIPTDVANMVYLLCKDEAAWINGAVIPVDGGEHIH